jgi:hypothetical protein
MATITFYPLGNADCYRIDLRSGQKLLFDYANTRCVDKPDDKRIDLPVELRKDLKAAGRDFFDVVAFTHLDDDHVCGAGSFFELWHAGEYQGGGRIKMPMMWVPAWAITGSRNDLCEDGRILQAEARYRLRIGRGIRVFSRPDALKEWLAQLGIKLEDRASLITDAGQLVPGWDKAAHGVEFFVHSPFGSRQNDGTFTDPNSNSLVFQAVFLEDGRETKALLMADTEFPCLQEMVNITRYHGREERLEWDLVKLPHHCSYKSLGPDKGKDKTVPVAEAAWMYEKQGRYAGQIVCTSDEIPTTGDDTQPPHRQAANYYRSVLKALGEDKMLVTMEHPTAGAPAPMVVRIDRFGLTPPKPNVPVGGAAMGMPAPRAG